MCGIFGYIGVQQSADVALQGLRRLEYRGYDSAGIVVYDGDAGEARVEHAAGELNNLTDKLKYTEWHGTPMLAHTRWSTHGGPTEENAHPHSDCSGDIYIAHNGIIENYQSLKEALESEGHTFTSETDSEVIAHLIEKYFTGSLPAAVKSALQMVDGAFALAIISKTDPRHMVLARRSSPLLIAENTEGIFAASDPAAVIDKTQHVIFLEDDDIATLSYDNNDTHIEIQHITESGTGSIQAREYTELDWTWEEASRGGYDHYMLKEIMEQPHAIADTLRGRTQVEEGLAKLGGLESVAERLRDIRNMILCACGTARYAGLVGEYMLEEYAQIPVDVAIGSEYRYRKPVFTDNTTFVAISQSGETADTLASLEEAQRKGALTLGVVNVVGSSIARATDAGVYNHAGPEIAVASTKAFVSQLTVLALLSVFTGRQRDMSQVMGSRILGELQRIPGYVQQVLDQREAIRDIAERYAQYDNCVFVGRKYNYPIALEGALKLKEISYMHAEGYPAGELKHGPLAMIDENFPTIAIIPSDSVYQKTLSNLQEVKARAGPVLAIATEGDTDIGNVAEDVIYVPKTLEMLSPLVTVVSLQLLAYYAGVARGYNVDKPRNLAKSVTVE